MQKEIKIIAGAKTACELCGNPTFLRLSIQPALTEDQSVAPVLICDKCIIKLLHNIYNKREDLVSALLEEKIGLSIPEIRALTETVASLQSQLAEIES